MNLDDGTVAALRWLVVGLAGLVAAIHLLHTSAGGPALLVYASLGELRDPRPPMFVLGGFVLVFAAMLVAFDVYRRPAYLLCAGVAAAFLVGYGLWHTVLDHGGFWPGIQGTSHADTHPLVVVVQHYLGDTVEFVSKTAELLLLVVALVLYRVDDAE